MKPYIVITEKFALDEQVTLKNSGLAEVIK